MLFELILVYNWPRVISNVGSLLDGRDREKKVRSVSSSNVERSKNQQENMKEIMVGGDMKQSLPLFDHLECLKIGNRAGEKNSFPLN